MASGESEQHRRLVEAMRSPGFYPHAPESCEVVETHISWVFLAGERAYKLRKPVLFPFLDYTTAERRRAFCEEEIRLGRRFAPSIYLGVRSVVERGGELSLGDPDAEGAIAHVSEMQRFDRDSTLDALLERGEVEAADVTRIGRRIAELHSAGEVAALGTFDARGVAATVGENFVTLLPHAETLGALGLAAGHRFASAFLHARRSLIEERAASGHVREGHGDLRAAHVIVGPEIEVFDPVEFDPELRYIDVLADVAFLVMDLAGAGREDLAELLVDEYREAAGESGGSELLWFYATYRAWVRAKVACLAGDEMPPGAEREAKQEEARELARLAGRLAWRARRPLMLVVCGGSATGKSHLSAALAERSGLPHLNSDVVRKELAGLAPHDRLPEGGYSPESNRRTYAELGDRAAASRAGAIVDATFRHREDRSAFLEAYGTRGPEPVFVECRAPAATVADRARARESDPQRASDADPELSVHTLAEFEPLDEALPPNHIPIRTDQAPSRAIDALEAALDQRATSA